MFYGTIISCLFKYNFKLLTEENFFIPPPLPPPPSSLQKKRLLILIYYKKSCNPFLISFICTRLFKFNKSLFLPFRKVNVKK